MSRLDCWRRCGGGKGWKSQFCHVSRGLLGIGQTLLPVLCPRRDIVEEALPFRFDLARENERNFDDSRPGLPLNLLARRRDAWGRLAFATLRGGREPTLGHLRRFLFDFLQVL